MVYRMICVKGRSNLSKGSSISWYSISFFRRREQLLAVTQDDIRDVAEKYLASRAGKSSIALLGEANDKLKDDPSWIIKQFGQE